MKQIIDNFSGGSDDYVLFRPESPKEIFNFLYEHVANFGTAWDCGTGNGQVAVQLADKFAKVTGTDISKAQLKNATRKNNITYLEERAEQTTIPYNSIDLITIAQAIHWFDFEAFYKEVRRVARPGAVIAAWTYSTLKFSSPVDDVVDKLYTDITGPYWDKERRYVDECYASIPFPFREIPAPDFRIVRQISIAQLEGYLRTWSGVKHYINKEGKDPVTLISSELQAAWGDNELKEVTWPVYMRAGYVAG